ncbi:hypothetical protein F8388_002857 [Cannabis sativa]|uniref:GRF-type domain-containing protein n=1 Tax=Cannabis sativa TaxID=3483 RepID=A0A7J6FJS2_CANSA|nr:hypothetical protein F8388_002857 [Cannabis sativa]
MATVRKMSCNCEEPKILKIYTLWMSSNQGRRFVKCPLGPHCGGCEFWEWIYPPMYDCATIVILGLLRKSRQLEQEILIISRSEV